MNLTNDSVGCKFVFTWTNWISSCCCFYIWTISFCFFKLVIPSGPIQVPSTCTQHMHNFLNKKNIVFAWRWLLHCMKWQSETKKIVSFCPCKVVYLVLKKQKYKINKALSAKIVSKKWTWQNCGYHHQHITFECIAHTEYNVWLLFMAMHHLQSHQTLKLETWNSTSNEYQFSKQLWIAKWNSFFFFLSVRPWNAKKVLWNEWN